MSEVRDQFVGTGFPSTMWILGFKLRSPSMAVRRLSPLSPLGPDQFILCLGDTFSWDKNAAGWDQPRLCPCLPERHSVPSEGALFYCPCEFS